MSRLSENREDMQTIVEAMAAVLDIEVTIYDDNMEVIASTGGNMHNKVGIQVRGYVLKKVMNQKKLFVNDQPGKSKLCKKCSMLDGCPEKADISSPIIINNKSVGVISLTAYNEEQRILLIEELDSLVNFLDKISKLIQSNLVEYDLVKRLTSVLDNLDTIINCVNEGVIAVDDKENILHINKSAKSLLKLLDDKLIGKKVTEVFPGLNLKEVLTTGEGYTDKEIELELCGKRFHVVSTARVMKNSFESIGAVVTLRGMEEVKRFVYEIGLKQGDYSLNNIITNDKEMLDLKTKIRKLFNSDSTVLITGESGTGKELFARAIHTDGRRKDKPFIAINCAAIPETLLESELFGYEGGAFTGASNKGKPGKFELAQGGTIFLDEIGDMPLYLQSKMLRAIENRQIERIGGTKTIDLDIRIIAATNKNLEEMVKLGEFREDLFFRINVIPFHIPPLRKRQGDILVLTNFFIDKHTKKLDKNHIRGISNEALEMLMNYDWPGNVRELENAIEYAVNMETSDLISVISLPQRIFTSNNRPLGQYFEVEHNIIPLNELEMKMIHRAIDKFGDTLKGKKQASEALGIDLSTLYRKLKNIKE